MKKFLIAMLALSALSVNAYAGSLEAEFDSRNVQADANAAESRIAEVANEDAQKLAGVARYMHSNIVSSSVYLTPESGVSGYVDRHEGIPIYTLQLANGYICRYGTGAAMCVLKNGLGRKEFHCGFERNRVRCH